MGLAVATFPVPAAGVDCLFDLSAANAASALRTRGFKAHPLAVLGCTAATGGHGIAVGAGVEDFRARAAGARLDGNGDLLLSGIGRSSRLIQRIFIPLLVVAAFPSMLQALALAGGPEGCTP